MIQFVEAFPDEQIVAALRRQLSWTHFKAIIPISDPLKRDFYTEMCRIENWNTRTLQKKIQSMLFERTAAFVSAINKVAIAYQDLGIFP